MPTQVTTLETAAANNKSKLQQGLDPQREMLEAEVTSPFILYVHSTEPWLNKKPKAKQLPFQVQGGCQEISDGIMNIFSGRLRHNG